jgi:hypothetical protein
MKNKKMLATILCLASLAALIAMTPGLSGAQTPLQTQSMDRIRTQIPGTCLTTTPTMDRLQTQTRIQTPAATQTQTQIQTQQKIQTPAVSQTGTMIQQRDQSRIHVPAGTPKR